METRGNKWVFWLAELGKEDIPLVGKKCAHLGEMTRAGLAVPPGFAIAVSAYERFMEETGAAEEIRRYAREKVDGPRGYADYVKASQVMRELVEDKRMPSALEELIGGYYEELCRRCGAADVAVAVRSSGPVSLPGQFETYLNVRGAGEVVRHVVRVWGSTFTTQAVAYRWQKGLAVESSPIGVAVLKMVNARSAGVAFTKHPTTGDDSQIVIEGAWGLGESVVGGGVAPDRFVIDKRAMRVIDRQINPKTRQVVYLEHGTGVVDVPPAQQAAPCLAEEELLLLARLAKTVEDYYGLPQDIEWAIDRDLAPPDNVFLVQTRPVTATKEKKASSTEQIINMMLRTVFQR